ncbi:MAG TPA: hypothetical protein PJ984_02815 [Candidatus Saccharibacteria bacterium]|nr:hypothetical protein [Patescibacteria group bacterium]HMS31302.1 hypothetical protein [Candidatus Saccharibacteria bacterium]
MAYLLISWIVINTVHGYVVYINRGQGLRTISENAAASNSLLAVYRVAHGINGLLLIAIVAALPERYGHSIVNILALGSVIFEWAQAAVPYRGKLMHVHTALAFAMAVSMVSLAWVLQLSVELPRTEFLVARLSGALAILLFGYFWHPPRPYSWVVQMLVINLVYVQIAVTLATT